ncbi:hypothetical protein GW17_00010118, partial [Ensete ventricosum]
QNGGFRGFQAIRESFASQSSEDGVGVDVRHLVIGFVSLNRSLDSMHQKSVCSNVAELRSAVHIEAIVSICKNMNYSVNAALKQGPQVDISGNVNMPFMYKTSKCVMGNFQAVGPMLHYLDGEQMTDDQALQANVLHVHQRCIEW